MAFHYKTQGIILKRHDQGEANRIFTVFCKEYGKLSMFAMSERKITSKLRGGLELFSLSYLEFVQGRNKKLLVEAIPLVQYPVSLQDISSLRSALKIAELINQHMGEQEKDERVWDLLVQSFGELQEGDVPEKAYQSFVPKFMTLAGYGEEAGV
ncbi:MAG: DNA repair protein RecO [bacterium]|nr:DNA repair protein RecO [bacterium]